MKKSVLRFVNPLFSDDTNALLVVAVAFKLNNAALESEECVVGTDTNIGAGVYVGASLANDDVTSENALTVRSLNAESLRAAITAVLGRTYTFFMCKKLQAKSQHNCVTSVSRFCNCGCSALGLN